jgi:hypothetical protein
LKSETVYLWHKRLPGLSALNISERHLRALMWAKLELWIVYIGNLLQWNYKNCLLVKPYNLE